MLSVYITGTYLIFKKIYFLTWKLSWERETDRQTDKERATCVHARNINLFVKVVFFFRLSSFKLQSSIDLLSHVYRNFLTIYYHTCTLFKVDKTRNHQKIQNWNETQNTKKTEKNIRKQIKSAENWACEACCQIYQNRLPTPASSACGRDRFDRR